jgi:hypothetical protein
MMDCKPYLALSVEYAAQVTPSNGKVWPCFYGFQIASLYFLFDWRREGGEEKRKKASLVYFMDHI